MVSLPTQRAAGALLLSLRLGLEGVRTTGPLLAAGPLGQQGLEHCAA